eukprot:TRINITY_DN4077_c0_g1_i1.p3 TRINITY_DN4077_c0_g1~~TRINITY_DN4077_c0_g1_i1.p3  ORF type:complete len:132 (+),score=26.16 TRINITY_DN4077_c0_g1_i1:112-507(+)
MMEMETIEVEGAEICVCAQHRLEYCGRCCCDYRDMNNEERQRAAMEKAIRNPNPPPSSRPVYANGTVVRFKDQSGRIPPEDLIAVIKGRMMGDPDQSGDWLECYILQEEGNTETFLQAIVDVHDEWIVENA